MQNETLQRVKVQHEIEQYLKRVQPDKRAAWKILTQKSATWKWCSMKKVQHEKSVTWKNINCHSEKLKSKVRNVKQEC